MHNGRITSQINQIYAQDGGEEIYRNGTGGSNPACFSGESDANFEIDSRLCHSIEINLKLELDRQKSKQMEAGQCLAGPATSMRARGDDLLSLFVSALRSDVSRIEGVVMRHASKVRGIVGVAFAHVLATFRVRA